LNALAVNAAVFHSPVLAITPFLPDFAFRAVLALLLIAAGVLGFQWLNRWLLARAQHSGVTSPGQLPEPIRGVPAIIYFTTPDCATCKAVQRPALQKIEQQFGSQVQIIEIDAQSRPDLASRWGVLSVPTTYILDAQGVLQHVNHGATRAEKLVQQIHMGVK
jgi:thiol-disulfide isomerase/thioredoxin